jgi:hypothetical protein
MFESILVACSLVLATTGESRTDSLLGASATVAAPTPRAFRAAEPAYATFRQGALFGYHLDVPAGSYRLEVGFPELIWRQPGQRVFDVLIGGEPVETGIDLVALAGRAPSRLERGYDAVAGSAGLRVMFRAAKDQTPVAWLRLRRAGDGETIRFIDCGGDADLDPPSVAAALSEQLLPRFGSRALLDLRPQWGDAEATPYGKFVEPAFPLVLGIESGGATYALPFARALAGLRAFDSVVERRTITRLRYDVTFPGHRGTITIHAPFDPGDLVGSALPVFRIEFAVERLATEPAAGPVRARVAVVTPGSATLRESTVGEANGAVGVETHTDGEVERGLFAVAGAVRAGPRRLNAEIDLDLASGSATAEFHLVLLSKRPIVREGEVPYRARVAPETATAESILERSLALRERLDAASDVVDGLVERAIMPAPLAELLRIAIPSFLMNTVDAESPDGRRFYSCIEGFCRYHATLDVEAHALPFYAWFAPELIALELRRAAANVSADDVMGHDIGRDGTIGAPMYPHAMPIEENTNFVLMVREHVAHTGDLSFAREHESTIDRLLARVRAADEDGDGLAERDVANTIDDGSAAVQYSRGQTYLAVKSAAAFLAAAALREPSDPRAAEYRDYAERIRRTLLARSWRGTHFALAADASAVGLVDPWKSGIADVVPAEVAAGTVEDTVLEGADSANGLAALGSIFALRTFDEPPVPRDVLAIDLATADERIARRFVLAHAEHEINGWVSLSLLRDAARVHLGGDGTRNLARYAELQRRRNRLDDLANWAGFCDSPYNRYLSYYPRGVAALALVDALAGLRVDRVQARIELAPALDSLRIPLPAFADWKSLRVPWLEVDRDADGRIRARVTEPDLLAGCDLTIDLSRFGGERTTTARSR